VRFEGGIKVWKESIDVRSKVLIEVFKLSCTVNGDAENMYLLVAIAPTTRKASSSTVDCLAEALIRDSIRVIILSARGVMSWRSLRMTLCITNEFFFSKLQNKITYNNHAAEVTLELVPVCTIVDAQ
jgi:hypothetical protein